MYQQGWSFKTVQQQVILWKKMLKMNENGELILKKNYRRGRIWLNRSSEIPAGESGFSKNMAERELQYAGRGKAPRPVLCMNTMFGGREELVEPLWQLWRWCIRTL